LINFERKKDKEDKEDKRYITSSIHRVGAAPYIAGNAYEVSTKPGL